MAGLYNCLPSANGAIIQSASDAGQFCLNGATTTKFNYLISTSTTGNASLTLSVVNQLLEGVFVFIRFMLPYAIVIGLLLVGLSIAWRVFRGVGKV